MNGTQVYAALIQTRQVSIQKARSIIDTRSPLGLFWTERKVDQGSIYIGVDNHAGDAWTEEFISLPACLSWLMGEDC